MSETPDYARYYFSEDLLTSYKISDIDDSGADKYYGFVSNSGAWYILKLTTTAARYISGGSDYTTNWSGRTGLTYDYFYNIF